MMNHLLVHRYFRTYIQSNIVRRTIYENQKDYMSTELTTINLYDSLSKAAQKFLDLRFRRFPVLDNRKLVEQIRRRDILKAIDNLTKNQ